MSASGTCRPIPAPLATIPALKSVFLGENSTDYWFLTDLPNLTSIVIDDNTAQHLGSLGHPAKVTSLSLQADQLTDISTVAGLTALRRVSLHVPKAADLGALANLTHLESLYVHESAVVDLGPLAALSALTDLTLYGTAATDLSPISGLTGLTTLDVRRNRLTALPGPDRLLRSQDTGCQQQRADHAVTSRA